MPRKKETDLIQGTLDLLVLKALTWRPRHGYEIMRWIREASKEGLTIEEGALYPALYRLRDRGWIEAQWGVSENKRKAKFYALTEQGRQELHREKASWKRYVNAVASLLESDA